MDFTTANKVFRLNDADDRLLASDRDSRYGAYLRARTHMFTDLDDSEAVTSDPVLFTRSAWVIACGPIMSPAYLEWLPERVQSVTTACSEHDGSLIARVQIAVPRPAQLRGLRGFQDWTRDSTWGGPRTYQTPYDDQMTDRPALLTSTVLLVAIPPEQLHQPVTAPRWVAVADAKAAVRRLAELLDAHLEPVLSALDRDAR
ncbi:hypothetical protein [Actinomadura rupiterrae]|uniref:hypothetical protein n=1 Tax=Actinomadura rupiterrae TaxID=559627 RepID=UPI0020A61939|nr:hypothetical protein [Actinomadura rupiterrae]MCP2340179.1 hypothetical protein [Actinomadura rupiterrae]